jgi:poly(A) polymerase
MQPALESIRKATLGTPFEGQVFVVGGAVRDELMGLPHSADFDLVTRLSSSELAALLAPLSSIQPVTYERFGTAMLQIQGADVELVTARRESYDESSRKPIVEPATLEEDAARRDFTINALMRSLHGGDLLDPTGRGLQDLRARVLRTPLDPVATFYDDPLRMLRAVRFKARLGFDLAAGLGDSIRSERDRLSIVSMERVRDELVKMLRHPSAPEALADLMDFGLMDVIAPEFRPMVGCEQGAYHHLDVWRHTLLVLKNAGSSDLVLSLGALFHDIGKPPTRSIDANGSVRFFGHEAAGATMTQEVLRRLRFPQREIDAVAALVKNHMRLGSSPEFTASAARRLLRDMGDQTDRLLALVEADANGLKAGIRVLDLAQVRARLAEVETRSPVSTLKSPLSGDRIMELTGIAPGPEVGRIKDLLTEKVLEGELMPDDQAGAETILKDVAKS